MQPRVAGVLLAAGEGSRLGQPKALVEIGGQRLADRGVALLRAGGAAPVVLVTGAAAVDVPGTVVVHNPAWSTGMGSSLTAGLAALRSLPQDVCGAAVIALADQPLVGPESVRRLIAAHTGGAGIAVAAYDGRPRNPVLIAREHWDEVLAMAHAPTRTSSRWSSAATRGAPTTSTRLTTSRASRRFCPRVTRREYRGRSCQSGWPGPSGRPVGQIR